MKRAWFLAHQAENPAGLPKDGWRRVNLPHQWTLDSELSSTQPDAEPAEQDGPEVGWYRLEFPEVIGRRWAEIRADYYCEAWVGTDLIGSNSTAGAYQGRHEGYFEPWLVEIPAEPDELLLRVSAPKEPFGEVWPLYKRQIKGVFGQHDCRPGGATRRGQELGTGGLWGGVRYLRTARIALLYLGYRVVKIASGWRLWLQLDLDCAEGEVSSAAGPIELALRLAPENFSGQEYTTRRTLTLDDGRQSCTLVWDLPEMPPWEVWERGFPHLYTLTASLLPYSSVLPQTEQTLSTQVGFRTVEQDGDWVRLNGERIFLRGTNIIPTQWLAGYTQEDAARDVALLREAHLNAVRVHAHLTHPYFYDACDRNGLLVWQDFPLQWGYSSEEGFADEAARQAQAMVKYYGHHPSIYLWCAHNEPTHNRHHLDPLLALALRQADSTRLVKETSDFREHPYPGWYKGHLRDFLAVPGGPIPSEFGAQALPRADLLEENLGAAAWPPDWGTWAYHNFQPDQTFHVAGIELGDSLKDFVAHSQNYQARLVRFAIEAYRRARGRLTGYFHFMFVEPWAGITWAVLDVTREPKSGFFALKAASAPVLLSLVLTREELEIGESPLDEAWLINDLLRPLDVRFVLRLDGENEIPLVEFSQVIAAQEARCIFSLGEFFEQTLREEIDPFTRALRSLEPGEYRLVGEAWEGGTLLSRSEFDLVYRRPMLTAGAGW